MRTFLVDDLQVTRVGTFVDLTFVLQIDVVVSFSHAQSLFFTEFVVAAQFFQTTNTFVFDAARISFRRFVQQDLAARAVRFRSIRGVQAEVSAFGVVADTFLGGAFRAFVFS